MSGISATICIAPSGESATPTSCRSGSTHVHTPSLPVLWQAPGRLTGESAHLCCDITSLPPVPLRCRVAQKRPRVQGTLTTSMVSCWKLRPPGICGVLRDAGCLNKKTPEHSQERLLCPTNLHSGRHFMGCWNGCAKSCHPCQLMSWQTCANVCAR